MCVANENVWLVDENCRKEERWRDETIGRSEQVPQL
jgi:hypothetical protein